MNQPAGEHGPRAPARPREIGEAAAQAAASPLAVLWQRAVRIARQIIGIPDYGTYVAHLRAYHPDRPIPTYAEFFNERLEARYKGGGGRCC